MTVLTEKEHLNSKVGLLIFPTQKMKGEKFLWENEF